MAFLDTSSSNTVAEHSRDIDEMPGFALLGLLIKKRNRQIRIW
jgi:hypothetical protein